MRTPARRRRRDARRGRPRARLVAGALGLALGCGIAAAEEPCDRADDAACRPEEAPGVCLPEEERPRFATLEDLHNIDSGPSFQAAWGMIVIEGAILDTPLTGFGVTIDDAVIEWKETRLTRDATDCAPGSGTGGQCATLALRSTLGYEGSAALGVSLVDPYPYDPVNPRNDCNLDGDFDDDGFCAADPDLLCDVDQDCADQGAGGACDDTSDPDRGDDRDCNDDGTDDVVVRATTDGEPLDVEVLVLDLSDDPGVYEGSVPVSATYDVPGTVFLAPAGPASSVSVRVQYLDRDDGTGRPCPNSVNPESEGTIEDAATIIPDEGTANVVVTGARVSAPSSPTTECPDGRGDDDPFADADETVCLFLTLSNKSGRDLDTIVARLATDDPEIECITSTSVSVDSLLEGERKELASPFVFKVRDDADRSTVSEDFSATFVLTMASASSREPFDALEVPQTVTLDLDLDITGGVPAGDFVETWDTLDAWTGDDQDSPDLTGGDPRPRDNAGSDGFRCQYNDPDFSNSNSYGETDCFLGFENPADNGYDWQIHTTSWEDGGRAYTANKRSLHWGFRASTPEDWSSRLRQIDAIFSTNPIYLGYPPVSAGIPELGFKHQISLMDYRTLGARLGRSGDAAVVHVRVEGADGTWIKLFPYRNVYDVGREDNYINCMYDPVDDGNDEDSFFDPADPNRRLGPSSTCWPARVYGWQGDTDYRDGFSAARIGRASDGPGLDGAANGGVDRGTWVETRFDLSRFAGRGVQVRFLVTSLTIEDAVTWRAAGWPQNDVTDDGWWIDDVRITNVLEGGENAPSVTVDGKTTDYGECGASCDTIVPSLTATPASPDAPGQLVELDASGSATAPGQNCVDGLLQYRFYVSADGAGGYDAAGGDALARDWTDNPFYLDAPLVGTHYGVDVRCSSAPETCAASTLRAVPVPCPGDAVFTRGPFAQTVGFDAAGTGLTWTTPERVDAIRGCLAETDAGALPGATCADSLLDAGGYAGTVDGCVADSVTTRSLAVPEAPPPGTAFYYLVRLAGALCNETGTFGEDTDRDAEIGADANRCAP